MENGELFLSLNVMRYRPSVKSCAKVMPKMNVKQKQNKSFFMVKKRPLLRGLLFSVITLLVESF